MFVGDVICDSGLATRLASCTTGLQLELLAPSLQSRQTFLSPARQVNVDRGSHAGAKVGGAGVQVAETGIQHEFTSRLVPHGVTNSLDSPCQSVKNSLNIST